MARCQARVHSGRKSAHRAQGALRAADVCLPRRPWPSGSRQHALHAALAPSRPLPCRRSRHGPEADRQPDVEESNPCLFCDFSRPRVLIAWALFPSPRVLAGISRNEHSERPVVVQSSKRVDRAPTFATTCYDASCRRNTAARVVRHVRLVRYTRESSTVVVLRSTNQTLGAPTPRLPPRRRPPVARRRLSRSHVDMPKTKSGGTPP